MGESHCVVVELILNQEKNRIKKIVNKCLIYRSLMAQGKDRKTV